ncbi:hypothetical protein QQF64_018516 [Cirrhinus molitorella]|uniref:L1 transposable element RRM domain-containing protein n=1 Tax=Cirrhinus molitorella TaxID=172907 RepID=A0ABR3LED9_9TELE
MANRRTTRKNPDTTEETPDGNEASAKLTSATISEENEVMKALADMKQFFTSQFKNVLNAIQGIKNYISEFGDRLSEAEHRISETEDNMGKLQKTVNGLVKRTVTLSSNLDDLENRNHRCNLCLVNLPEKVEETVPANFLEKWFTDVFGASTFPSPAIIERAHRISKISGKQQQYPRVLIMKFLNFHDWHRVIQAVREMGIVKYQEHKVMFFPDISIAVRKQRKQFDDVKKRLQVLNVPYRCVSSQTELHA